jgi:hypothetical protein
MREFDFPFIGFRFSFVVMTFAVGGAASAKTEGNGG